MRFPISITHNVLLEPFMAAFGVTRDGSYVDLADGVLEVAMGRWFHEKIPVASIASVAPSEWPWYGGLGVKLHHHGVGIVGSTEGVVNVKLKGPTKAHVIVTLDIEQLWISIEDRDGFVNALGEAGVPVAEFAKFWGD